MPTLFEQMSIGNMPELVYDEIVNILEEQAGIFVDEAKALVPVRTGALRDSIYATLLLDPTDHSAELLMGTGEDYGLYVEYGTGDYYNTEPAADYNNKGDDSYSIPESLSKEREKQQIIDKYILSKATNTEYVKEYKSKMQARENQYKRTVALLKSAHSMSKSGTDNKHGMRPQPYLRPAYAKIAEAVENAPETAWKKVMG